MRMDKKKAIKFKKHLEMCIGKPQKESEMLEVGKRLAEFDEKGSSASVKEAYENKLANLWDKVVAYENDTKEIEMFLSYSNCRKDSVIMSIGSGLGVFESFLAKEVLTSGEIICADFSEVMSKRAEEIKNKLKLENMEIIVASAEKLPIKSGAADIFLARRTGLSIGNLWEKVLKEARRVINPEKDSRLIYTVRASSAGSVEEIKRALKKAGFEFIKQDFFFEKDKTKIAMIVARPMV